MYLATDETGDTSEAKAALGVGVELANNSESLESSSLLSSGVEIDLKKIKLGRLNVELQS